MAQFGNRMFVGQKVPGLLGGAPSRPSANYGAVGNWKPQMGASASAQPGSRFAAPNMPPAGAPLGGQYMAGGERPGTYGVPAAPSTEPPLPPMTLPQMGAPSDMMYRGVTPPPFAGNAISGGRPTLPPMMGAGNSVAVSPPPAAFDPNTGTMAPGGVRPGTYNRLMPRGPRAPMRSM